MTLPLRFASILVAMVALTCSGCATKVKSNVTQTARNPAPAEKFSAFTRFELKPVALAAPYAGQEANEAALKKIQENADARLIPLVADWNKRAAAQPARTLVIQPTVTEIKFINGTARFWTGALAGSSIVVIETRFIEKETGRQIAKPEFYSRAAAMSGAWSFGGADNAMLVRIANRLADYVAGNYDAAVGGATGAEVTE